jgi:hypothetical protein
VDIGPGLERVAERYCGRHRCTLTRLHRPHPHYKRAFTSW